MATVTFHDALGTNGTVLTQIDWANLTLIGFGNTARLVDPNNVEIVLQGENLLYGQSGDAWEIASGTVTSLTLKDGLGTVLFQVTDTDADANWLFNWISSGTDLNNDVNGGPGRLWGTDNTVYGAAQGEHFLTGYGDDIIFGGGGNDQIQSTGGDDTVTGGRGRDEFVEIWGGSMTITDFRDTGPRAQQDVIRMTRWEYRNMVATQSGDDAVLTVTEYHSHGATHLITLLDFDMAGLDARDFVLGF